MSIAEACGSIATAVMKSHHDRVRGPDDFPEPAWAQDFHDSSYYCNGMRYLKTAKYIFSHSETATNMHSDNLYVSLLFVHTGIIGSKCTQLSRASMGAGLPDEHRLRWRAGPTTGRAFYRHLKGKSFPSISTGRRGKREKS